MASFQYKGRAATGEVQLGAIDAVDEISAAKMLLTKQITPIFINPSKKATAASSKVRLAMTK